MALSSRNAYLDTSGRSAAPLLYKALAQGQYTWETLLGDASVSATERIQQTLAAVRMVVETGARALEANPDKNLARVELDYVCLNDPSTLAELADDAGSKAILSGALWIRNHAQDAHPATRIIDNLLLGFSFDP